MLVTMERTVIRQDPENIARAFPVLTEIAGADTQQGAKTAFDQQWRRNYGAIAEDG